MEPREGDLRGPDEIHVIGFDAVDVLRRLAQESGPLHGPWGHQHRWDDGNEAVAGRLRHRKIARHFAGIELRVQTLNLIVFRRRRAQARRERDAEMRALRAERAEQQKRARQEARAERDAATAAVLEQVKVRKSSLRTADDASLESALQRRAALEKAVEQRARLRGSTGSSRGGRLAAAAVAEVFWHVPGMCESPGCMFPNHHLGPCSHEIVKPGSRRASSIGINYCEPDETDLNREYGLLKPYRRGEGADEAKPAPKKAKPAPLAADRMLATGHVYIGRRIARLFGRRLVLGTIAHWLPACKASGAPALFRAVHDDGDEEDLEEAEVADARGDYETLAPRETRWLKVKRLPSECHRSAIGVPSECHRSAFGVPSECLRSAI